MKIVLTCALLMLAGTAVGADVQAQPAPTGEPADAPAPATAPAPAEQPESGLRDSQGRPIVVEPMRPQRGSGFWTSSRPAKGGAYRYRLLGIGLAVFAGMLAFMLWVIRRNRRRAAA